MCVRRMGEVCVCVGAVHAWAKSRCPAAFLSPVLRLARMVSSACVHTPRDVRRTQNCGTRDRTRAFDVALDLRWMGAPPPHQHECCSSTSASRWARTTRRSPASSSAWRSPWLPQHAGASASCHGANAHLDAVWTAWMRFAGHRSMFGCTRAHTLVLDCAPHRGSPPVASSTPPRTPPQRALKLESRAQSHRCSLSPPRPPPPP